MSIEPIGAAPTARRPSPREQFDVLARAWVAAHRSVDREFDTRLERIEGAIPDDLRGVLYRNGPGRTEMNGVPYRHLFDGDGMITRFGFDGRGVSYRNRYVHTREYLDDIASGTMRYRSFGTNRPGGAWRNVLRAKFKNAANTSVVQHGGRLLALWEGGLPHEIDPVTLETRARFDFDGALLRRNGWRTRLLGRELPFAAHPKICPRTGDLFNFGLTQGRTATLLSYRVDPSGAMLPIGRVALDSLAFVHDFVLTEHHSVFFFPPVAFDVASMFAGIRPPADGLTFAQDRPGKFVIVRRDGGAAIEIPAPPFFLFHWLNGYERPDGTIVVDGFTMESYPQFPDLHDASRIAYEPSGETPVLTRFVLDPTRKTFERVTVSTQAGELATVNPKHTGSEYRYGWAIAAASSSQFFTGISKYDVVTGETTLRDFAPGLPGEPIFVPRPDARREDDGYVMFTVFVPEVNRTDLFVLDGATLATRARLRLPHHVPPGFHGTFVPASV